jgi:predicted nucleic acid-binding protein
VPWAVLDSSVYIRHWERGLADEELAALAKGFIVRHSAVVLSELRRGARTVEARRLVAALFRLATTQWAPIAADWWEAARVIQKVGDAQAWDPRRRRDFQNDVLIGLTARRYGATVVTTNRAAFELIAREVRISVFVVSITPGS